MNMVENLAIQERRDYQKQWRQKNPDKVKKHTADYWRRRAEKKLAEKEDQGGK